MHPIIAKFLDISTAKKALERADAGAALEPAEAALAAAGKALPKSKQAILKNKSASPSPETQQHLIVLATEAATTVLEADPAWAPKVQHARAALKAEGADDAEAHHLIAQAVLEEAFGYADDPTEFDEAFLTETFATLEPLAKVTADTVDDLVDAFARRGEVGDKALRVKVAEVTLESAWSDGPQPIAPEHLDDALDEFAQEIASKDLPKAFELTAALLGFLAERRLIGTQRLARLMQVLTTARTGDGLDEALEEEPVDDAEEEEPALDEGDEDE